MAAELTLGPNLFHWPAQQKLDFYNRIADESAGLDGLLGEVMCSKRTPFFEDHLERGGRPAGSARASTVVFCSLSEVVIARERNLLEATGPSRRAATLEVNNTAALLYLQGQAAPGRRAAERLQRGRR
jgi:hypothetical protein